MPPAHRPGHRSPRHGRRHQRTTTGRHLSLRPRRPVHVKNFGGYCRRRNIKRSLGRTGTCYDNAVSESSFATYKKELIHTRPWPTVRDLLDRTRDWIQNYYNTNRRHSTLNYLTPKEYELELRMINQFAA